MNRRHGMTVVVTVNGTPVPMCECSDDPHWSTADMVKAKGRPLTSADVIRVDVKETTR